MKDCGSGAVVKLNRQPMRKAMIPPVNRRSVLVDMSCAVKPPTFTFPMFTGRLRHLMSVPSKQGGF